MSEYHKIQTIYKRDMAHPHKLLIEGEWSRPEFEYLANNVWTFTEKVDGTNIRVSVAPGRALVLGGRTDAAQLHARLVARLNSIFLPQEALLASMFTEGAVLYGEGYGAGIQKAGVNYRQDKDFVLFDVRVGKWWLNRADVEGVAFALGLDVVPVIGAGTLHDAVALAKAGIGSTWGDFEAEGIVARPRVELQNRAGDRIIAKIKCRDFKALA